MIRLAVIGTNWISNKFVEAALATSKFSLSAVYSRKLGSAQEFAAPFQTSQSPVFFTDLNEMADSDTFDAVYIASPNSLHAPQSIQMLKAGKHVICEKPIASNLREAEEMYQVAKESGKVLFEAYKSEYLPNFKLISEHLPSLGKLHKATFSYCQYSSRYQKYLDGENPNTFNPAFSNGSIMDIGYYAVASAVALFGEPEEIIASAYLLDSGVDAHGCVILQGFKGYPELCMTIQHSKVTDSHQPSEIQGEAASMSIHHISACEGIEVQKRGEEKSTPYQAEQAANTMFDEALYFAQQIESGNLCEKAKQRSLATAKVLTEVRRQTGVVFPADSAK